MTILARAAVLLAFWLFLPAAGFAQSGPYHFVWDTRPPDDWLDLWSLPGGHGALLEHMPNGTPLEVLELGPGEWLKVRQVNSGAIGWAAWGNPYHTRVWVYCCMTADGTIPLNPQPFRR